MPTLNRFKLVSIGTDPIDDVTPIRTNHITVETFQVMTNKNHYSQIRLVRTVCHQKLISYVVFRNISEAFELMPAPICFAEPGCITVQQFHKVYSKQRGLQNPETGPVSTLSK